MLKNGLTLSVFSKCLTWVFCLFWIEFKVEGYIYYKMLIHAFKAIRKLTLSWLLHILVVWYILVYSLWLVELNLLLKIWVLITWPVHDLTCCNPVWYNCMCMPLYRTWNIDLWRHLFHTLLNVPACDKIPDLTPLRQEFESYFVSKLLRKYNNLCPRYNKIVQSNVKK